MSAPRWAHEGRDWPHRARSHFVEVGPIRWHYQRWGEGRAILLLHGTGAATHSWRGLAPLLAEHFTVIAPDLPGHGFSTGRPAGGMAMAPVARAVAELTRKLDVAPVAIVGHSAGAAIMARMVLDGRAAPPSLVGLDAALLPFPGLAARLFPALARALFVNPLAPHLFARMARVPGETARFLHRSTGSRIDAEGVRAYEALLATSNHCAGALAMMAGWDLAALASDLPRLAPPLLLLHGDRDTAIPIAGAREAAAIVGDGRVVPLAGLGHLAHEERPGEVASLIRTFVEEHR